MTIKDKQMLEAMIRGCTTRIGGTQRDPGEDHISPENYAILKNFIKNFPIEETKK